MLGISFIKRLLGSPKAAPKVEDPSAPTPPSAVAAATPAKTKLAAFPPHYFCNPWPKMPAGGMTYGQMVNLSLYHQNRRGAYDAKPSLN